VGKIAKKKNSLKESHIDCFFSNFAHWEMEYVDRKGNFLSLFNQYIQTQIWSSISQILHIDVRSHTLRKEIKICFFLLSNYQNNFYLLNLQIYISVSPAIRKMTIRTQHIHARACTYKYHAKNNIKS